MSTIVADEIKGIDDKGVLLPTLPVFFAWRSSNYTLNQTYTNMVYDKEDIDVGNNYDTSTGIFTVPQNGIYEFGWNAIATNTATIYRFRLAMGGGTDWNNFNGGAGRYELRYDQAGDGGSAYASNGEFCAYVSCTTGQQMSIQRVCDSGTLTGYGDPAYRYTYFRGRLVA